MPQRLWIPFGCCVKGASHRRKEKEYQDKFCPQKDNQDAFYKLRGKTYMDGDRGKKMPSIIAISDGHGGDKYIRSKNGSVIAVHQAGRIAKQNMNIELSAGMRKDELTGAIRHIKTRYLLLWQQTVDNHVKSNPFTDEEKVFLKEHCSQRDYDIVVNNPRIAYGCTFLCAMAYEDLVLIIQLGDGDILGLYANDEVSRELTKSDPRNIGNETLSLCSLRDVNDIAHEILIGNDIPKMITLTTDGVKNSYNDLTSDIEAFYSIPVVIENELKKRNFNIDAVKAQTEQWLEKITTNGSGDDVTIGVLYDSCALSDTDFIANINTPPLLNPHVVIDGNDQEE